MLIAAYWLSKIICGVLFPIDRNYGFTLAQDARY